MVGEESDGKWGLKTKWWVRVGRLMSEGVLLLPVFVFDLATWFLLRVALLIRVGDWRSRGSDRCGGVVV